MPAGLQLTFVADSETWRNQRERRYQLDRDQARDMLEVLARELPAVTYTEGSRRTLVVTTYLDSPARDYRRMVEESDGNASLKVRVREYLPILDATGEIVPSTSCHLERKERVGELRHKQRVKLPKRSLGAILRRAASVRGSADVAGALEAELDRYQLEPVLVSIYERSVFGSDRGGLRVTFDERLRFHAPPDGLYDAHRALTPDVLGQAMAPGPPRILELKDAAGTASPAWLERMLTDVPDMSGYSKFRDGMATLDAGHSLGLELTRSVFAG